MQSLKTMSRLFLVPVLSVVAIAAAINTAIALKANAAVWETTQSWTPEWEDRYREWVKTKWHRGYFLQEGPLKGLLFDCADTVYTMRVLFSSANGLPFVIKDPTTSENKTISNEITRFDEKNPQDRLRAFNKFIMSVASTSSLPSDSYPVAISRDTLGSGSFLMTGRESHHSWTIKYFSQTGIPFLVFGSRPAKTELYERFEYPSASFIFKSGVRAESNAGFRSFRHPEDIGKKVYEVPGYSLEQYRLPAGQWVQSIQKKMQQVEESSEERVLRILNEACKGAEERVAIVRDGIRLLEGLGSRCMTATEYDDHSTPSRDSRMKSTFLDLADAYRAAHNGGSLSAKTRQSVESVLRGGQSSDVTGAYCRVEVAMNRTLSLGEIYERSVNGQLSNNPHDTLDMRWGYTRGPSAKAQACPVY